MLKIFKMDMRRTFRSKAFYSCLLSMLLVSGTMIFFGMLPDFASATGSSTAGDMDMTSTMMGIGMAFIMMSISFAIGISSDFSSGFSKNIFSRHTNPARYIGGKILSLTVVGAVFILSHTLVSMLIYAIMGGMDLTGGVIGLVAYIVEKIFISAAFASLILMVYLFARHIAPAIIVGVIASTGIVSSLLALLGSYLNIALLSTIGSFTISGLSAQSTINFSATTFFIVIVGSVLWTAICGFIGSKALKRKDIA